jgi:predicted RNA-binding Zn ribbon-like protein
MPANSSGPILLGGRLAVDFANAPAHPASGLRELAWEEFVAFLEAARVVSHDRGLSLLALPRSDPQAAELVLTRAIRLRDSLRKAFNALVKKEVVSREWIEPINQILRITEGHDELVAHAGKWKLEFIAREGGLDWLLAAVARSAAEIVAEGSPTHLRLCANPACGLFFWDDSRTRRRRWCSMAVCGNRHKVASFARRRAS